MVEAERKSINLAQELYIHYQKQNYLDYKSKHAVIPLEWGLISEIYNKNADILRGKMAQINNLTNKDGKTVADVLGIINDINGNSGILNEIEQRLATDVSNLLKQGIGATMETKKAIKTGDIQQKINALDKYTQYIHQVIDTFNTNNDDYMNYLLQKYTEGTEMHKNITNLFSTVNGLNLLAINQTAFTSFQSLKTKMEYLEGISHSLGAGKRLAKTQNSQGKWVEYESIIYPMHFLFTNILGGLGEGLGAAYALNALNEYLKTLETDNMTINIEGTGTQKSESGTTKKADYTITIDEKNGSVYFSFGISAKAQAITKGKKITTTFETTTLKNFFDKYIQFNNLEQYIFYNNLYHNINSAEMQYLRRKYAAMSLLNAITGVGQGENVLFIQYLDQLVRLDEFFENLASLASANSSALPTLKIFGATKLKSSGDFVTRHGSKLESILKQEGYKDLNNEDKSIVAWVRSRQTIKKLNELKTQIQYTHE